MNPEEFISHCKKEFGFLSQDYGFTLEPLPKEKYINEYQARFVSHTTRIAIEGVNWGFNIDIRISSINPDEMKHQSYCFNDLLTIRNVQVEIPELESDTIPGEVQVEQMKKYAVLLKACAEDILKGDHSCFAQLAEKIDQRILQITR